ncbi:isocitrate dehydrogenase (NAD(+)) [Halothermothrix orenii]|uniref:3-isopropylmalate dehydrogenase n=1 Tax=Halothermothrix orenii (strain H 168 / OCM 544 / DSM 9562) TaxID=373903 RepID=B8CW94_HALOH|nr:isocitrate dehydrogenase (NAD(+)) [Halothermothrix orenii]ACL69563.1 3-isopropylmalate dehydrogenase [Halothermothrix orenii H 168]
MITVTLIPGDGIGPEITDVVVEVFEALGVDVDWEVVNAGKSVMDKYGTPLPDEVIESIKKNKVALKGPITTPVGSGFRSVNVAIRKKLNLYANLRPVESLPGLKTRYDKVNLVVVRENTEGLYSGVEHKISDFAAESIKIITRKASERIIEFAFSYAKKNDRQQVTAVHKANIMKISDGLFLDTARKVAEKYPGIEYNERIIDNMCMQLVQNPEDYDVLVMPNFYGDIVSDLGAGLVGGLGVTPGANIGDEIAVFEAVHGSAPDIAGKGVANPVAILRSSIMLLNHIGESEKASKLDQAIKKTLVKGKGLTPDLGGQGTTRSFKDQIINNI